MNTSTITKSAGILAVAALLASGSAQACMPGMSSQSASAACPSAQGNARSCPTQGLQNQGSAACATSNKDMLGAVGTLASGGMGIAMNVLRAVQGGLSGDATTNQGI